MNAILIFEKFIRRCKAVNAMLFTVPFFIMPFLLSAQPPQVANAFYYSSEIVVDSKGNLFVTGKNNKIIKITPDGIVYDFAGHPGGNAASKDGKGNSAMFDGIKGIAIDNDDNMYVADYCTVRKVTPDGMVTTIYGNSKIRIIKDGNGKNATFHRIDFIAIDNSGVLYVTDEIFDSTANRTYNIIRKITTDGIVTTIKKTDGNSYRAAWIYGLACDKGRNLYVSAVAWNSSIDKITPNGTINTIAGKYSEDRSKPRLSFKEGAAGNAGLIMPYGIAFSKNGDLYFSEADQQKILKLANDRVTIVAGKVKDESLQNPHGIAFDKTGNLYIVSGSGNGLIRKISPDGIASVFCKQEWNPLTKQYETVTNVALNPPANKTEEPRVPQKDNTAEDEANRIREKFEHLADSLRRISKQAANTYIDKNFESIALPSKDTARIKRIPSKNFSVAEIRPFLKDLHTMLAKILPASSVSSATAIAKKLSNDPKKIEEASLIAWQNGAVEEAVLLITDAASNPASDGLLLTNTGAILDMSGLSEKAIPVLRTIVRIDPQNAIAQNNLGQAYCALGMQDSAIHYLDRCLNLSPQHPEANNTAGFIEFKKGNKSKAQSYFENSIRGGFNLHAYNGLIAIKKDYKINKLIKPDVKIPEYFNQFKYKLPRQCTSVDLAEEATKEHDTFKRTISELRSKYSKMQSDAAVQFSSSGFNRIKKLTAQRKSPFRPFQPLGYVMQIETTADYLDEKNDLDNTFNKEYKKQYTALEQQYESAYKKMMDAFRESERGCCGEGNTSCCLDNQKVCNSVTALRNRYLEKFAFLTEEWQTRNLLILKKYFDDIIYWNYFSSYDDDDFRMRFYSWVNVYLSELDRLCKTKILEPCVWKDPGEVKKIEESELKKFDCPVSLSLPFIIGKLQMDCESFSIKAGQGVLFRFEQNLVTRQSTVSIGVGVERDILSIPGVMPEVDVKLHMSVFLCFDKSGNISDGGLVSEAKAAASLGFGNAIKLKFKEGIGWRLGYNTGLSLTPGFLKDFIDNSLGPAKEIPVNKNIKIFNQ